MSETVDVEELKPGELQSICKDFLSQYLAEEKAEKSNPRRPYKLSKGDIRERLKLASNLFEQAYNVLGVVRLSLLDDEDSLEEFMDYMNELADGESPDIVMEELEKAGFLNGVRDEECHPYPRIKVNKGYPRHIDVHVPLDNGNNLTAFASEADFGTYQAGVVYSDHDGYGLHDLAMAEVPRDEFATINGFEADNDNVVIYTYSDPKDDDYTAKSIFDVAEIPE